MDNAEAAPIEETEVPQEAAQEPTLEVVSDRPEWLPEKFKSPEDMAKSYAALESKLGAPKEVPEEYQIELEGELLSQVGLEGVEELHSDPMVSGFLEMAKEEGVSGEFVNKIIGMYLQEDAQILAQEQERQAKEMAALGKDGKAHARINELMDFAGKAPPNIADKVKALMTDAASVEVFEWFRDQAREAKLPTGDVPHANSTEDMREELAKMQFAVDDNGNRKLSVDPEFRKRFREMQAKVYGTAPKIQVMGG